MNLARATSATTAQRRSQPRTVANATPTTPAATLAMLDPVARAVSAAPITPTASRRRSSESAGNSTWVRPHDERPRPPRRTAFLIAAHPSDTSLTGLAPRPQLAAAVTLQQAGTQHTFDLDVVGPYHPHRVPPGSRKDLLEVAGKVIIGRVLARSAGPSPVTPLPRQPAPRPHQARRRAPRASSANKTLNNGVRVPPVGHLSVEIPEAPQEQFHGPFLAHRADARRRVREPPPEGVTRGFGRCRRRRPPPPWPFEDYEGQYEIAYEAAVDATQDQRTRLELIRGRGATVLSAAALVTAFLGQRIFDGRALGRLDTGWFVVSSVTALWIAMLSFVFVVGAALWSWRPVGGEYANSGLTIVTGYVETEQPMTKAELLRELALWGAINVSNNEERLKPRQRLLSWSYGALGLEILMLLLVLWDIRP